MLQRIYLTDHDKYKLPPGILTMCKKHMYVGSVVYTACSQVCYEVIYFINHVYLLNGESYNDEKYNLVDQTVLHLPLFDIIVGICCINPSDEKLKWNKGLARQQQMMLETDD